jgi:Protein of unknown function (DUF3618)
MTTTTSKNGTHREPMTETEALRVDLEQTRQHLADTVQQLSQRLNVPHRVKESAGQLKDSAGQHPKAVAAVGGAVALGLGGAVTWMVRRHK